LATIAITTGGAEMKESWDKPFKDMDFNERVDWAVGYIIFGIARGQVLKSLVWEVSAMWSKFPLITKKEV